MPRLRKRSGSYCVGNWICPLLGILWSEPGGACRFSFIRIVLDYIDCLYANPIKRHATMNADCANGEQLTRNLSSCFCCRVYRPTLSIMWQYQEIPIPEVIGEGARRAALIQVLVDVHLTRCGRFQHLALAQECSQIGSKSLATPEVGKENFPSCNPVSSAFPTFAIRSPAEQAEEPNTWAGRVVSWQTCRKIVCTDPG